MEAFKAAWRALRVSEREAKASIIGAGRRYLDNVALSNERRVLSPKFCVGVEKAFDGHITCESLAPDEAWGRLKDRSWPHKDGRPILDYGRG